MNNSPIKTILFLIIILLCISIPSALAQTNSCNLQLNVYKYQKNPAADYDLLKSAAANLENVTSHTKIKATYPNEIPYFADVPKGTYTATVLMNGYKLTTKEIQLTCESVNEQNLVSENMFLWKGSPKETIKMFGTLFGDEMTNGESPEVMPSNVSKIKRKELTDGKAKYLPQPVYSPVAKAGKVTGKATVQIIIDEIGKVISAKLLNGDPLLRELVEKAAKESRFESTRLQGVPIKIVAIITYNFH